MRWWKRQKKRSRAGRTSIVRDKRGPMTGVDRGFVPRGVYDRVVVEVCRRAYADGCAAGRAQAVARSSQVRITVVHRRTWRWWIRAAFLVGLVLFVVLHLPLLLLPD